MFEVILNYSSKHLPFSCHLTSLSAGTESASFVRKGEFLDTEVSLP